LDGGLVGRLSEASQQVADLLLTGVDDLAGRGLVDGIGHPPAELLELLAELLHQRLGGYLRLAVHGAGLRLALHGFFLGFAFAHGNALPGPLPFSA
jgi:hypothetical protein